MVSIYPKPMPLNLRRVEGEFMNIPELLCLRRVVWVS